MARVTFAESFSIIHGVASFGDEQWRRIRLTRVGLILLTLGIVLLVFPFLDVIGSLLLLIGGVLLFSGRGIFGSQHSILTVVCLPIYLVVFLVTLVVGLPFDVVAFSSVNPYRFQLPSLLGPLDPAVLYLLPIADFLTGLALFLSTDSIQKGSSHSALQLGFVFTLLTGVYFLLNFGPAPIAYGNLLTAIEGMRLFKLISLALFGLSYYTLLNQFDTEIVLERFRFSKR